MQNFEILRYNLACTCSCLEITLLWVLPFGKEKIGFLYNFSLAQQNELKVGRVILSRRSASSEPRPFSRSILKVEIWELYYLIFVIYIGYLPRFFLLPIGPGWDYYCLLAPVWVH